MKATSRVRREANRLFRLCLMDGRLDEERLRQVVRRVGEARRRNRLAVLGQLRRLVKRHDVRHAALVESAVPLNPDMRGTIRTRLERLYGAGLNTSFEANPALIGGMRIRVGSDVYDGSLRGALDALAAKL